MEMMKMCRMSKGFLIIILIAIVIVSGSFGNNEGMMDRSDSSEEEWQSSAAAAAIDQHMAASNFHDHVSDVGSGIGTGHGGSFLPSVMFSGALEKLRMEMETLRKSVNESIGELTEEMRNNFKMLQESSNQQYHLLAMMKSQNEFQHQHQNQIEQQPTTDDSSKFTSRAGYLLPFVDIGNENKIGQIEYHPQGKPEPPFRPLERFSPLFDDWRRPMAVRPLLKVYFFNVTNPVEFLLQGAKLKVAECGPYVYSQKWKKVGIQWNDDGSISFRQRRRYFFESSLSTGSESDVFILPNVPLLSVVALSGDRSKMYKKTLSNLLDILGMEPFMQYTVHDYLWGYQEPLMTLGKQLLPARVLERMSFDKFGVLREKNGSELESFTVFTGKENQQDFSTIKLYNEHVGLGAWGDGDAYSPCNLLRGATDWMTAVGTGVYPNLHQDSQISIFEPDLCRIVKFQFNSTVNHQGWSTMRFVPTPDTFGGIEGNPENKCFCVDGPPCDKKGLFNISPCKYGAPLFISYPHFLHGDPELTEAVEGLQPDPVLHQSFIDILPNSGVSMEAKGRIQFNIQMARVEDIVQASYFQTVLLPVLWIEEGIDERDMTKLYASKQ